ncbi:LigA protein [Kutzneria sp. 744]|nr:LigA protein [Kutzneria sp. 744]
MDIVRKLTAVSQHAGAANAAPGDVSKAGLNTLLSGAGADINGILGTLTSDVNPAVLAAPVVSADAPAALTGKDKTVGPDGGLLGLSAGLPDVDSITPGAQVDPSQVQYDPSTGHYVDKTTGNVIDPKTGLPMLPGSDDDSPTGQFPVKTGQFPVNTGPAGAPPPDNSAAPTGPVPRHVIDAAAPAPNYGGGYSPPPVYSDPTPTGPVHVPPPHAPQGTTVQSAAAPVYSPAGARGAHVPAAIYRWRGQLLDAAGRGQLAQHRLGAGTECAAAGDAGDPRDRAAGLRSAGRSRGSGAARGDPAWRSRWCCSGRSCGRRACCRGFGRRRRWGCRRWCCRWSARCRPVRRWCWLCAAARKRRRGRCRREHDAASRRRRRRLHRRPSRRGRGRDEACGEEADRRARAVPGLHVPYRAHAQ